jgi:hypothetical protein
VGREPAVWRRPPHDEVLGRTIGIIGYGRIGREVYWEADRLPQHLGIAVGAFADPSFPAPTNSVWERTRHPWVAFGQDLQHFPEGLQVAPKAG